jgi:predicted ATPase
MRSYCSNACRQRAYRRRMARSAVQPARPGSRIVSNLPAERDSFIGRQHELTKLARLLRKHRLVTLMGSAGAGKTRLAVTAAGQVDRAGTDRVLLVELGSVTAGQLLVPHVAAAAGLTEHSDEPILETVIATLRTMRVLVVLDNCEHLLEACAKLVDTMLSRCPAMRILATSREALRITGEVTFQVGGLGVPGAESTTTSRRADSVRLFVERARELLPDSKLPIADARAVAALCTRLDGIPLAIELAARWVPVLSASEICARLDSRFDLLVLGGRIGPNRQRSLREAIDWSYELLSPTERRALRRLSVFVGSFDLDAAAAVCALDPGTTLDMLSRLRAKSLLTAVGTRSRFRLLESIRLYAMHQLTEQGEADSAFEALAGWLAGIANAFVTEPMSLPKDVRRMAASQSGTLRVVCEWTGSVGDHRHVLLSTALAVSYANYGFLAEARKVMRDAVEHRGPPNQRCVALDRAGWYAGFQGDFAEGMSYAEEGLAIARTLSDPALITTCLTTLACVQQMAGHLDLALRNRTECLDMVRDLRQPFAEATCLAHLAWSLSLAGDQEHAHELATASLAICRERNSTTKTSEALIVVGGVALALDDLDAAENAFREVRHINAKYPHNLPTALEGLAVVAARRGEPERALRLYQEAEPMRRATGVIGDPFWEKQVTEALGLTDASHTT